MRKTTTYKPLRTLNFKAYILYGKAVSLHMKTKSTRLQPGNQ